ncbi:riboflavin biosynthesis protein RibF [Formicincola oecophyllae]|uniref:Riboflavin biosynthesis protein n=2 Tax=Formicincola oecophyllae TaxID=2558361 RepID=A0A4Y6UA19_9PROT|nr:riboflavin biosynthesis protein RibF [Formicincola oecophyllae]
MAAVPAPAVQVHDLVVDQHGNLVRPVPEAAQGCAVALGNFDGVHKGHAHLLHALAHAAPRRKLGVVTFDPHPRSHFRPQDAPFRLSGPAVQNRLLGALGVHHVFRFRFDTALARCSPDWFVNRLLLQGLAVGHVACGADFAFGHRRAGTVGELTDLLSASGVGLCVPPALMEGGAPVSSSRIRRLLQEGYPDRAAVMLGRPWLIEGMVVHGDQRGRTLGFPTANVPLGLHVEPARGVYVARVRLMDGRTLGGVANVGSRPTVARDGESRLEVHLFDFDEDIYGQALEVELLALLRSERRFASLEALKAQITQDAGAARAWLASHPAPTALPLGQA